MPAARKDRPAAARAPERGERDRLNAIARHSAADVKEVGPIPPVKNRRRRNRGLKDPEFFHRTYFPNKYKLAFGSVHREAIRTLADCTENGGQFAQAMMRGGGKTTIAETECIRALVYGLRRYLVFVGATDPLAARALKRFLRQLETNDLLYEDFPEVCHPIRSLERQYQRCRGQTVGGVPTRMEFPDNTIVFPTVAGSLCSGSVIQSFGLTGAMKGLQMLAPDGTPIRPDMVVLDDCQTRGSAKSPSQTEERERIILDDVMGLAGPETELAAVFLCTPIYPNDLTERFLDRERNPEWQGTRTRMVEAMPADMEAVRDYGEFRREAMRDRRPRAEINAYYLANRERIETGCVLAWPDRVKKGDVSAVQTALNLYLTNPTGFQSEYQCEPEAVTLGGEAKRLDPRQVEKRFNGHERFQVPTGSTHLTAMIDLSGTVHWYAVCAWNQHFGGAVIDYGAWPRQARKVFTQSDASPALDHVFPHRTEEQRVFAGLESLAPEVLSRVYIGPGRAEFRVGRLLVDAGKWPKAVYDFIRRSPYGGSILPSKGVGRSETSAGVARWKKRDGEQAGYHWRITTGTGSGHGRQVQFDPDAWKSFVHAAMTAHMGGPHGLTLWGSAGHEHTLIAEHCGAEFSVPKELRGETFDKWRPLTHRPDNHLFDCLVGCAVAASVQGLTWNADGSASGPPAERKRVKLSDLMKRRQPAAGGE